MALRQGNAHFQVAKNPARPFVVEAGGMEFRAIGTAFAIQLTSAHVEMLVTEGRVAIERAVEPAASSDPQGASAPAAARLALVEAGSQALVNLAPARADAVPQVTPLSPAELGEKLAWRVPRLELTDTPLAEAIAAINRHSPVPLEIKDEALGKVSISGVLRADNIEPLLRILESNYSIQVDRSEPGKVLLRKAEPAARISLKAPLP
jgi:transmembrane sensor